MVITLFYYPKRLVQDAIIAQLYCVGVGLFANVYVTLSII